MTNPKTHPNDPGSEGCVDCEERIGAADDEVEDALKTAVGSDGTIVLTRFIAADVETMMVGDCDPELRLRFQFPDSYVPNAAHSLAVLARWEQERIAGTRLTFAVRDRATGMLMAGTELQPNGTRVANLSYWTYPAYRNRGIASRAVAVTTKLAFGELSIARLELLTDPDNIASRKVALRSGFKEAGSRDGQILHVADNPLPSDDGT